MCKRGRIGNIELTKFNMVGYERHIKSLNTEINNLKKENRGLVDKYDKLYSDYKRLLAMSNRMVDMIKLK